MLTYAALAGTKSRRFKKAWRNMKKIQKTVSNEAKAFISGM
jgi:hypothetical protein